MKIRIGRFVFVVASLVMVGSPAFAGVIKKSAHVTKVATVKTAHVAKRTPRAVWRFIW